MHPLGCCHNRNHNPTPAKPHVHAEPARWYEQRLHEEEHQPRRQRCPVNEYERRQLWRNRPPCHAFATQIILVKARDHQRQHDDRRDGKEIAIPLRSARTSAIRSVRDFGVLGSRGTHVLRSPPVDRDV